MAFILAEGLGLLALLTGFATAGAVPTVTLSYAVVQGLQAIIPDAEFAVNKFLGIPYADRPVRFAPAKKPLRRKHVINATAFPPACTQNFGIPEGAVNQEYIDFFFTQPESEDCLFINVFAPAAAKHGPPLRPVLVHIPGGGWQVESATSDLSGIAAYDGVVGVTFNYRTNAFGFPSDPDIPPTERNLGLLDQRLAMEWVQEHIAKFGGDPRKVTICGQSAGAHAVDAHMMAYANATNDTRPFRAAIMSSGQSSFGPIRAGPTGAPGIQDPWAALALGVGCNDRATRLKCMRSVNASSLKAVMLEKRLTFGPAFDGVTYFGDGAKRWREGRIAKVPVIMGTVAEEARPFVSRDIANVTAYLSGMMGSPMPTTPDELAAIVAAYPRSVYQTDFDVAAAIQTDWMWQCPQATLTKVSASTMPTYRYFLDASLTYLFPPSLQYLGKCHGTDVAMLTIDWSTIPIPQPPQIFTLVSYFRDSFARFVANPPSGPGWPAFGDQRFSAFGYTDLVAVLGNVGSVPCGGATPISAAVVDARCKLYEPLYSRLEGEVG